MSHSVVSDRCGWAVICRCISSPAARHAKNGSQLHRVRSGKADVRIDDHVDGKVPVLRWMFDKRLRGYRAIGFDREEQNGRTPEV